MKVKVAAACCSSSLALSHCTFNTLVCCRAACQKSAFLTRSTSPSATSCLLRSTAVDQPPLSTQTCGAHPKTPSACRPSLSATAAPLFFGSHCVEPKVERLCPNSATNGRSNKAHLPVTACVSAYLCSTADNGATSSSVCCRLLDTAASLLS